MKILFLNFAGLRFNVATPDNEPLGGTESSVCYLARQLAINGHDVTLIARLPENSPGAIMGIRHFPVVTIKDQNFFTTEKFDVLVTCNTPIVAPHLRQMSPHSFNLTWVHMAPDQQAVQELGDRDVLRSMDGIIYVSEWQKTETEKKFGINKESCVIGNGLTPAFENMFASSQELLKIKENRAAYTSTPYRGLLPLLNVMDGMRQETELDVFSSMRVYQRDDDDYAELYRRAAQNPRIHCHGAITQAALAQRLRRAAFLAYPCVFAETYCLAALEAMAAGMKVISTRLGALEATTMGYADLIPVGTASGDDLVPAFRKAMEKNIAEFQAHSEAWAEKMFEQASAVNRECSWAVRAKIWEKRLTSRQMQFVGGNLFIVHNN